MYLEELEKGSGWIPIKKWRILVIKIKKWMRKLTIKTLCTFVYRILVLILNVYVMAIL